MASKPRGEQGALRRLASRGGGLSMALRVMWGAYVCGSARPASWEGGGQDTPAQLAPIKLKRAAKLLRKEAIFDLLGLEGGGGGRDYRKKQLLYQRGT